MDIKKLKSVLVLDFDAGSVKAIVGHAIKDELIVKQHYTTILPDQVILDGKVLNQAVLENILKNMLRINKIKTTNCFCCIESSQMISRDVVVPNSPQANFQDVATFEMSQHVPVDIKSYVVQSKKLKDVEVEGKPYIEAYTTAVPNNMIQQLHTILDNVGLKPLALDTHSNALAKLIETQGTINGNRITEQTAAFIEFGHESIYISLFKQGKFIMNRLISIGSKDLDLKISKFLEISLEQATSRKMQVEDLSNERPDAMTDDARLWNMVRSTIESWFDEVDKTFRFYASRHKEGGRVEQIYVYGNMTQIQGFVPFCQKHFKVPTEKVHKFNKVAVQDMVEKSDLSEFVYALGTLYRR